MTRMEERIHDVIEAFQAGDLSCYAPDADLVDAAGAWRRGRNEIGAPPAFGPASTVAIRFLGGDVAVVHLGWHGKGITTLVVSRTRSVWKIDAAQTSGSKGEQR